MPEWTNEQALAKFRHHAAVGRECLEIDSAPLDARIAVGRALLTLEARVAVLDALMAPCGAAEAHYRAGGPWGDNEEAALTAVLNACIEAHKRASGALNG